MANYDGSVVGATTSTIEAPTVIQEAFDLTVLQPGTRVVVRYKPWRDRLQTAALGL